LSEKFSPEKIRVQIQKQCWGLKTSIFGKFKGTIKILNTYHVCREIVHCCPVRRRTHDAAVTEQLTLSSRSLLESSVVVRGNTTDAMAGLRNHCELGLRGMFFADG